MIGLFLLLVFIIFFFLLFLFFLFNNILLASACILLNFIALLFFLFVLFSHMLFSLNIFLFSLFIFLLALFLLLLFAGFQSIIDWYLSEIMMSEKQREISITVTLCAQDYLVLLLRKRRIFWIHVLHDCRYLFRVHNPNVLEPHHLAVDAAKIAIWSHLWSYLLQSVESLALRLYRAWFSLKCALCIKSSA